MKKLQSILFIIVVLVSSAFLTLNCEEKTHYVRVVITWTGEQLYEMHIEYGGEYVSKTQCGSNHPTLPNEGEDCIDSNWMYIYEENLRTGGKLFVAAETVPDVNEWGSDEYGSIEVTIYVDGNKMIEEKEEDASTRGLRVTAEWYLHD